MERVQVWIGADDASERVAADSLSDPSAAAAHGLPGSPPHSRGRSGRMGAGPCTWQIAHDPTAALDAYRVRMETPTGRFGSIWAFRAKASAQPDQTETRLLAAAADQVGQALAHDRLAAELQAAEIARQSDELKIALVQSVSHDLRTPLATIRAAAGSLRPTERTDRS